MSCEPCRYPHISDDKAHARAQRLTPSGGTGQPVVVICQILRSAHAHLASTLKTDRDARRERRACRELGAATK